MTDELSEAKKRYESAKQKKATLEGQLKSKGDELRNLLKEIEDAGYDPKRMNSLLSQKQTELNATTTAFLTELEDAEEQLAAFS